MLLDTVTENGTTMTLTEENGVYTVSSTYYGVLLAEEEYPTLEDARRDWDEALHDDWLFGPKTPEQLAIIAQWRTS